MNGIIFLLRDEDVMILLQFKNGTTELTFTVGKNTSRITMKDKENAIFDGKWHSIIIKAFQNTLSGKSNLALNLMVDNESIGEAMGNTKNEIKGPLYLGGIPTFSKKEGAFNGCIRNVKIDNNIMPELFSSESAVHGDVRSGFCSLCDSN